MWHSSRITGAQTSVHMITVYVMKKEFPLTFSGYLPVLVLANRRRLEIGCFRFTG